MSIKKRLSGKQIKETFKKVGFMKPKKETIEDWIKKSEFGEAKNQDVWIVSDSTSAFSYFNQESTW